MMRIVKIKMETLYGAGPCGLQDNFSVFQKEMRGNLCVKCQAGTLHLLAGIVWNSCVFYCQ